MVARDVAEEQIEVLTEGRANVGSLEDFTKTSGLRGVGVMSPGSREADVRSNAPEVFSRGPDVTSSGPSVTSPKCKPSLRGRPVDEVLTEEVLRSSGSRRPVEVQSNEGRDVWGISWKGVEKSLDWIALGNE